MLQDRLVSLRHPHKDDYHRQGYDHPSSARDTALMAGSPTDTDTNGDDDDEAPTGNLTKLETSKHDHEHDALNNTPVVRPPPAPPAANKILFLDGLRGLAAMMVVVQHVAWMGVAVGQPAVDTFFVLSAFLLTMIFEKKARTLLAQKASYRRWMWALLDYFARRFLRVYPLFAFVAIYLTVYSPAQKEKLYFVHHPENYNVWKVLTFSFPSRYHVFWTLPLEITYYFIIPVFVLVILAFKRFWFVPIAALLVHVIYTGFYWYRGDHIPLKTHLPTFLCGSVFAIIYSKIDQWITAHSFEFKWWHKVLVRTLEFTSIAWMMSTVFNCLLLDWVMKDPFPSPPAGRFVSIHIAIMMVCEMLLPGALGSMLEWSLLRYAGKVSFSMYLLHSFVIYSDWIKRQGGWNHFFAIWGLVFLLSTVSYNLIEYPCQWLAGRVGAWIKKKDTEERERTAARLPTFDRSHEHV